MSTEKKVFQRLAKDWVKQGLAGKYVAIYGESVLGISDEPDSLPKDATIFRIVLPSAGAWANDPELLEYFYDTGLSSRPNLNE